MKKEIRNNKTNALKENNKTFLLILADISNFVIFLEENELENI